MDDMQMLRAEVRNLTKLFESLKSERTLNQVTYYENLPHAATVGKDYVAYRFNCSEAAVVRGRFDTDQIPRLRNKPIAFSKRDVDAVWQNLHKSPAEKAAEFRRRAVAPKKTSKN